MPHKEIKSQLDELKDALNKSSVDTRSLEEKVDHIRGELDHSAPESLHEWADLLRHGADEFEADHPQITALINQVMISLSNLGI